MNHRDLAALIAAIALFSLVPAMVAAPPAETSGRRTADGQPDIQGTYTFPPAGRRRSTTSASESRASITSESWRFSRSVESMLGSGCATK